MTIRDDDKKEGFMYKLERYPLGMDISRSGQEGVRTQVDH